MLKEELAKRGLSDVDPIVDPKTGKKLGNVLAGKQYTLKLYKTSEQNYSARSSSSYDQWLQPGKGGEQGSKSIGPMEMYGLLASNARANLREISTIKAQKNDDFWVKFMSGQPLPKPQTTFATKKFFDYLKASGVNTNQVDGKIVASPHTDMHTLEMSHGEIREPTMLDSKNLEPEHGGLYDMSITGGLKGNNWSHFKLAQPIVNPTFETPLRHILGLSKKEFHEIATGKVGVKKVGSNVFHFADPHTGKILKEFKIGKHIAADVDVETDEDTDKEV